MYSMWAIFAGIVGLIVTGAAVYTLWHVYSSINQTKEGQPQDSHNSSGQRPGVGIYFLRWTVLDAAMLALFAIGMLFLFVDLLSVMRNPEQYPYHHYAYILVGFIFSFLGMLFMIVRLSLTLQSTRMPGSGKEHHNQPEQADSTE
ncbi:hypothetical protein [Paenibacillus sp. J2TS4]|uniref:hypothetical protein n=1 Tax=Paenibacillus sp. J2TS4 TaxID=2807194 RepID=UPI001B298077|nr:hypothetical protein [Paenibacillus sp. J2TS4]GIP33958.1 hypothetical protein J2TS4_31680 [Paenibacillus sp. J2TS4]